MSSLVGLAVSLLICFTAAFMGSRYLPDEWFKQLHKPSWNPPSWLFAPVWTILYTLMAIAAWIVWSSAGWNAAPILVLFLVQLTLNAAWTWIFFGRHRPDHALVDIVALWLAIVVTFLGFWQVNPLAGLLLIPYLVWVSFAGVLNYSIWQLNR